MFPVKPGKMMMIGEQPPGLEHGWNREEDRVGQSLSMVRDRDRGGGVRIFVLATASFSPDDDCVA